MNIILKRLQALRDALPSDYEPDEYMAYLSRLRATQGRSVKRKERLLRMAEELEPRPGYDLYHSLKSYTQPSSKVYDAEFRYWIDLLQPQWFENKGRTGYQHSDETKSKIGQAHIGMKRSDRTRANISAAMKGRKAHNKGKTTSDAQKQKQRAIMSGRVVSPKHRAKIIAGLTGRKHKAETVAKRAAKHRGSKRGVDARLNISLGRHKHDYPLLEIIRRAIEID